MPSIELNCRFTATGKPVAEHVCRAISGKAQRAACYGAGYASLIAGVLLAFAADAAGLSELPNGANRDLVSKVCQSCHDLQMVLDAAGNTREDWDMSLDEMAANGMSISADERTKILDYLSMHLGPSKPRP